MRRGSLGITSIIVALLVGPAVLPAQQKNQSTEEVNVRGVLYSTEPKPKEKRRPPKPTVTDKKSTPSKAKSKSKTIPIRPANAPPPVGLGYTIFKRQPDGSAVRADPSEAFYTGDQIRIMFEPGIDGYLYIIHREGANPPKLLFPRKELYKGNNYVRANTAVAIPSEAEPKPEHRWFVFQESDDLKGRAARVVEHLTVILSRDELQMDADWILGGINSMKPDKLNLITDTLKDAGASITEQEERAIRKRDLDLGDAPEASVVVANFGTAPLVTAKIDLVHKMSK